MVLGSAYVILLKQRLTYSQLVWVTVSIIAAIYSYMFTYNIEFKKIVGWRKTRYILRIYYEHKPNVVEYTSSFWKITYHTFGFRSFTTKPYCFTILWKLLRRQISTTVVSNKIYNLNAKLLERIDNNYIILIIRAIKWSDFR